jgi:hypothetical protein
MRVLIALGVLAFALGSAPVRADGGGGSDDGHHCPDCVPETRDVCFNLVCHYDFDEDHGPADHEHHHCTAAATFTKAVTLDGGEVADNSHEGSNPALNISCDDHEYDPRPARRFTGLLGTRIQGETGPTPAILLPRGELHTGPGDQNSGHYSKSILELDADHGFKRGDGSCFIWTGLP